MSLDKSIFDNYKSELRAAVHLYRTNVEKSRPLCAINDVGMTGMTSFFNDPQKNIQLSLVTSQHTSNHDSISSMTSIHDWEIKNSARLECVSIFFGENAIQPSNMYTVLRI